MRIAIAGFYHETNSFGSVPVTPEVLRQCTAEQDALRRNFDGVRTYLGGIIDEAREQRVELVPAAMYLLNPSGPITRETFEQARDRIVSLVCEYHAQQPLDGIMLAMHGAAVADGYPDAEAEVFRAIRETLGSEIPIAVCLDLHGNISDEMVDAVNILIGVRSYPHIDEYDTGREAFSMLCGTVRSGRFPCKRLIKLPWLLSTAFGVTTEGTPGGDVRQFCLDREAADPDLLRATVFHGFPYSDIPAAGVSIVTMAATQEAADRNALEIAKYVWSRRRDFTAEINSAAEAVDKALAYPEGPVLINESSDNPGGGTPGDGTYLLRELLQRDVDAAFGFIYDAEVAAQAAAAGVGAHIRCRLGGKTDSLHGKPIEIEDAYVRSVCDGEYIRRPPMGEGKRVCLGTTVCLQVGRVSIVVAGLRTQTFDDGPFRIAGVDWQTKRILALKSSQHFKGWWADKVKAIVPCDSPGVHGANVACLPLEHADLSYYPLKDAVWEEY